MSPKEKFSFEDAKLLFDIIRGITRDSVRTGFEDIVLKGPDFVPTDYQTFVVIYPERYVRSNYTFRRVMLSSDNSEGTLEKTQLRQKEISELTLANDIMTEEPTPNQIASERQFCMDALRGGGGIMHPAAFIAFGFARDTKDKVVSLWHHYSFTKKRALGLMQGL